MFKSKLLNTVLYFCLKYLVFYLFLMFKNHDFTFLHIGELKNFQDWFYYLWLLLFFPIANTILFSLPISYAFKAKKAIYFLLFISSVFVAEYLFYTYLASQSDLLNGLYCGIIGLPLFVLFFFRHIRAFYYQHKSQY